MYVKPKQMIRFETIEQVRIRNATARPCEGCGRDQIFLRADRAAVLFGLTAREVYRLVETGKVHFFETTDGSAFVCAASMTERNPQKITLRRNDCD